MLDLLALATFGCLLGTLTGLAPGLHVNTVAVIGLAAFPLLGLSPIQFAVAMVAMAVTHSFLDFIPSIFLGVPEEDTALSVLPAHRLVLEGKALDAVKLTALGSLLGLGFALLLLAPTLAVIPALYGWLRGSVVYVLAAAVLVLVWVEGTKKRMLLAATSFTLSGCLGVLMFDLGILSPTQVMFPAFAGLFGISNLLVSMNSPTGNVPQHKATFLRVRRNHLSAGFLGALAGLLVGLLPAMSPSQLGILLCGLIGSDVGTFLVYLSAINTSDAIFSFVSLYTIDNARSGVATMVGKVLDIGEGELILLAGAAAYAAAYATAAHLRIGRAAVGFVGKVDYRILSAATMLLVFSLVWLFTGWFGFLLTILATAIGLVPILAGVSRTHCMGVLLVPTMLYFLNL
jgi:putative membrane protein